jgi:hypothetical protein
MDIKLKGKFQEFQILEENSCLIFGKMDEVLIADFTDFQKEFLTSILLMKIWNFIKFIPKLSHPLNFIYQFFVTRQYFKN